MPPRELSGMKRSDSDRTDEVHPSFPRNDSFHRNESITSYGYELSQRLTAASV